MSNNNITSTTEPTLEPTLESTSEPTSEPTSESTSELAKTSEIVQNTEDDIVITEEDKKQFINKMVQYRNTAITFIGNNKKDLASIYLQHSNATDVPDEDRCGVLGINLVEIEEKNNVDVAFIPIKILHIELVNQISERKKENDENIIYFLLLTPVEEKILEIDIRTLMS
jgi:hypothetical protein